MFTVFSSQIIVNPVDEIDKITFIQSSFADKKPIRKNAILELELEHANISTGPSKGQLGYPSHVPMYRKTKWERSLLYHPK